MAQTQRQPGLMTAEEFEAWVGDRRCELVHGEVVDLAPVGRPHGRLQVKLSRRLDEWVEARNLGEVHTEVGHRLARGPDVVRAPDVSFIDRGHVARAAKEGFLDGAPALAIEVLSPGERLADVALKAHEYLAAGGQMVWLVDPQRRRTQAFRRGDQAPTVTRFDEPLSGDPVLPGFSVTLSDLLPS